MWGAEVDKLEARAKKAKTEFEEAALMAKKAEMEASRLHDDKGKLALDVARLAGELDKTRAKLRGTKDTFEEEKATNANLRRENDALGRELDDLKSRASIERTEIAGYNAVRLSLKGLEGGTNEALTQSREELAKLNETRRLLEVKVGEIEGKKGLKDDELARLERNVESLKVESKNLSKANLRMESDLRLGRKLEGEIDMLQRSRDMASNEAMRAEEASLHAREQLRNLERKLVVATNMKMGENEVIVSTASRGRGERDGMLNATTDQDDKLVRIDSTALLTSTSRKTELTTVGGDLNIAALLNEERERSRERHEQGNKGAERRKRVLNEAIKSVSN